MCKAFDDMLAEHWCQGWCEGWHEGWQEAQSKRKGVVEDYLGKLWNTLLAAERYDDLILATKDRKHCKKMLEEFRII